MATVDAELLQRDSSLPSEHNKDNDSDSFDSKEASTAPNDAMMDVIHNGTAPAEASAPDKPVQPSATDASLKATANSEAATMNDTTQPVDNNVTSENTSGAASESTSASYSTRTRTRGARPNYAEDYDNMDFEYTSQAQKRAGITPDSKSGAAAAVNGSSIARAKDTPAAPSAATAATNTKKRKSTAHAGRVVDSSTGAKDSVAITRKNGFATSIRRPTTNVMSFEHSKAVLNKDGLLVADDGATVGINDHYYLVCEPPGDPYYLCRIMEFIHTDSNDVTSPVERIRCNWYYRPRDVQRYAGDTRLVYGTMHSDVCPLTSLRGKCTIHHRSEITDLDEYRKGPDSFYFSQIFDRFIRRFYEVIPCSQIINVPEKVKKALDERWKYVALESTKVKELTSAIKTCKYCTGYCASHDSVVCALCQNSYHMSCVKPPLPKKPSRGFGWSCGPCSRAQEKKLEARHTPQIGNTENGGDDHHEEEEEEPLTAITASTRAPSPEDEGPDDAHPATQAEIALAKMWPMRYLGIHCRVEDALQYDDRAIYPRASSRLGPRHQAAVSVWHGRPLELVKPADIKKKYIKTTSHKKDAKLSKETLEAISKDREERAKRPKWVVDEPPGYVARGEDYANDDPRNTAQLLFKMPDPTEKPNVDEKFIGSYMKDARNMGKTIKIAKYSTNLADKALELLTKHKFDSKVALEELSKVDRGKDLKEPVLTKKELLDFVEGVRRYGSEHRLVRLHMETKKPTSTIVRFYYLWKKTKEGKKVWGNYDGRKGSKKIIDPTSAAAAHAEVADVGDDSAFDYNKAKNHKRTFQCKFCSIQHSAQWRRAPGVAPGQTARDQSTNTGDDGQEEPESNHDNRDMPLLALCLRCAGLWRRYAIKWEGMDEIARKIAQNSSKGYKRRIDEELLREFHACEASGGEAAERAKDEAPRKKLKTGAAQVEEPKKKPVPVRLPTPPPVGRKPVRKQLACAVCKNLESAGQMPVTCTHCFLAVHRHCYGLASDVKPDAWVCDQCSNDQKPVVSTDNVCTLCPIEYSYIDMWEHPKVSHKKKTDRDREQDRLDKQLLDKAKQDLATRQQELSRPLLPREPLKKTDGNNWMHVICAVFTPEIKFSKAQSMERAEGIRAIPANRFEAKCKLCKKQDHGACVACHQCHASFHVACAFEAGYTFGFDVTPVKGSRKDQVTTVNLPDESGTLTAAIWCRDHTVRTIVHPMHEVVDEEGTTVLQLYVDNFKQADTALAGTARKANLLSQSTKSSLVQSHTAAGALRRSSTIGQSVVNSKKGRSSLAGTPTGPEDSTTSKDSPNKEAASLSAVEHVCGRCGSDASPKFYSISKFSEGVKEEFLTAHLGTKQYECHHCHYKHLLPEETRDSGLEQVTSLDSVAWPPPLGHFPVIHKLRFVDEESEEEPPESGTWRQPAGEHYDEQDPSRAMGSYRSQPQHMPHPIPAPLPSSLSKQSSNGHVNGVPSRSHASSTSSKPPYHGAPFVGLPPPIPSGSARTDFRSSLPGPTDRRHNYASGPSPPTSHGWTGRSSLPPLSSLASPPSASGYPPDFSQDLHGRGRSNTASRLPPPPSGLPDGSRLGYNQFSRHGSPSAGQHRPSTPQDASGLDPRRNGGASASPNLGNLLS